MTNKRDELVTAKLLLKSSKFSKLPIFEDRYGLIKLALSKKRTTKLTNSKVNSDIKRSSNKFLYEPIRLGKLELVKKLVSEGSDVNLSGINGLTPLHIAVKYRRYKIMEFLLKNGANVSPACTAKNRYGLTPLHIACRNKDIKSMRLLLKFNAEVGAVIPGTVEPIHIAVIRGDLKLVSLLLKHGANVNARFKDEFYPILSVNLQYRYVEDDFTLLLCAISMNSIKIAKLLLKFGAIITMKSKKYLITPLIEAIETNNPKMVKFILNNGGKSQINQYSAKDTSPLHHVLANADNIASPYNDYQTYFIPEKLEIFNILLAAGADLNAVVENCCGWTVLEVAIHSGYRQIVNHILHKTDIDLSRLDYSTVEIAQFHDYLWTANIQDRDFIEEWKDEFKAITYDLIFEILRRNAIGLFTKKETLDRIHRRPDHIDVTEEDHQKMIKEMEGRVNQVVCEMKKEYIGDSNISFWNLLTVNSNRLINLGFNENFQELRVENYKEKYSIYYNLLENRVKYALEISNNLSKAYEFLNEILNEYHCLPYYCIESIVRTFNDDELKSFVNSFENCI